MDSPALGKAELVVGGYRSWTLARASAGENSEIQSKKKAQRTARAPCVAPLAASHVNSSRAAPAAGTPLANLHTQAFRAFELALLFCIFGG
jgi:hypothetical protein